MIVAGFFVNTLAAHYKMIKLIPVIEITCWDQGLELPKQGPYWEYPNEWNQFNALCCEKAGFKDPLIPIDLGASLYEITKISDDNLKKIILDHTQNFRNGEYGRDDISALFGGYVLEIDGTRLFYPQCCGDLSDLEFWRNLAKGNSSFYEGHPAPVVTFKKEAVVFDLTVGKYGEDFVPIPSKRYFQFNRLELKEAIKVTESVMAQFAQRLEFINQTEALNLERIEDMLMR